MVVLLRRALLFMLCGSLGACAVFSPRDPLIVQVAGLEPAPGADLEWRAQVKLRVQNPNREPVDYAGVALALEVNGQPLASGVSAEKGTLGGYSEALLTIPVTVSAFSVLRQAWALADLQASKGVAYRLNGKLDTPGLMGAVRFSDSGRLDPLTLAPPGTLP
ncbi:LEA type 2 family protein [Pseudomonas sp. RIT-PI-S]|uniref:LEA type 2 family protein n=1 Tax=Pseudomonas sp. RIT-PI-S TaxID=3035295 RepID=UPI0021DA6029|nr:LEA type 2 family protein [Pseudomonas sp. RIT-PI-S]